MEYFKNTLSAIMFILIFRAQSMVIELVEGVFCFIGAILYFPFTFLGLLARLWRSTIRTFFQKKPKTEIVMEAVIYHKDDPDTYNMLSRVSAGEKQCRTVMDGYSKTCLVVQTEGLGALRLTKNHQISAEDSLMEPKKVKKGGPEGARVSRVSPEASTVQFGRGLYCTKQSLSELNNRTRRHEVELKMFDRSFKNVFRSKSQTQLKSSFVKSSVYVKHRTRYLLWKQNEPPQSQGTALFEIYSTSRKRLIRKRVLSNEDNPAAGGGSDGQGVLQDVRFKFLKPKEIDNSDFRRLLYSTEVEPQNDQNRAEMAENGAGDHVTLGSTPADYSLDFVYASSAREQFFGQFRHSLNLVLKTDLEGLKPAFMTKVELKNNLFSHIDMTRITKLISIEKVKVSTIYQDFDVYCLSYIYKRDTGKDDADGYRIFEKDFRIGFYKLRYRDPERGLLELMNEVCVVNDIKNNDVWRVGGSGKYFYAGARKVTFCYKGKCFVYSYEAFVNDYVSLKIRMRLEARFEESENFMVESEDGGLFGVKIRTGRRLGGLRRFVRLRLEKF